MVTFCTASSGQVDRFPSLTLLVLFITSSKKAQCTVSLQMHPAFVSRSVSRLPHLALTFGSFSLHQCSRLYIYKDRRTDWPQLLTY